jgi:hypothetical protein
MQHPQSESVTTIISGRRIFIKLGCIPFLTRLSIYDANMQSIGFPIGEEIFVDVDLDRIYSAFTDPENITMFLLQVLQKLLGDNVKPIMNASYPEAVEYFSSILFKDDEAIAELVQASACVPRDFLRIFGRAFRNSKNKLPITIPNIREATHDFFIKEKRELIKTQAQAETLFENIFTKVCLPAKTYIFFVSQEHANSEILRELWHHRLLHLLFEGLPAFASDQPRTFDIYAIDYGRFILMRSYRLRIEQLWTTQLQTIPNFLCSLSQIYTSYYHHIKDK